MSILLGLHGFTGTGKDTVGDRLWAAHGYCKMAFADPLRDMVAAGFGIDPAYFHDRVKKEEVIDYWGHSPRQLNQKTADAIKVAFGADFFVRRWELAHSMVERLPTVVTDVRFPLEADAIRAKGGVIAHIVRPGRGPVNSHSSEKPLPFLESDIRIDNNADLEKLMEKTDALAVAMQIREKAQSLSKRGGK